MSETSTSIAERPAAPSRPLGRKLLEWASTTDHKVIGRLYMVTAFGFFLLGGLLAMAMRAELAQPGLQFMNQQTYNELFTIHGTI
ncbi:cbb3-type cytochrome c oxidase subunit I, partial [Streptomyces sp. CB01373]|uniref:cbb3-type cytochrome c oxidase subunit I n=2 Tax=unclassified Streptomyces TaxID=2593676 RepID=UPI001F358AB4